MTIYWERCSICEKHQPTRQCWLVSSIMVCANCCIFCLDRSNCSNPVWIPTIKFETKYLVESRAKDETRKALEDLLKRLEKH